MLGPDQLDIIREINQSKRGSFFIYGEAGCGKSFVLLYLLYQHTAKDLDDSQLKKVVFFIPKQKTEFRKFVETFVANYCHSHLVNICDHWSLNLNNIISECELSLVDESYAGGFNTLPFPTQLHSIKKFVVAVGFSENVQFMLIDSMPVLTKF